MLREKLPVENYELFKYVVEFLVQVNNRNICDKSINDVNVFFIIFSFRLWIVKILTKWHLLILQLSLVLIWCGQRVNKCHLMKSVQLMHLLITSSRIMMIFTFSISIKRNWSKINKGFCSGMVKEVGILKNPQNEILEKRFLLFFFYYYYFVTNFNEFLIIF